MKNTIKEQRLEAKFQSELGSSITSYLLNDAIVDIMLNPDGRLWVRDKIQGFLDTNENMDPLHAHQLIGSIADHSWLVVNESNALLETELPIYKYRFVGLVPPLVISPCFTIRKSASLLFSLDDYIEQKIVTDRQAQIIRAAINANDTILIAGGPGTGKTTFANALLHEMVQLGNPNQRFILIEDTRELQCSAPNTVPIKTNALHDYDRLLNTTLRKSPERIILGECRGKEIITLLNAWNTGTKGGLTTIHSNSAKSALLRVSEMAKESGDSVSPRFICESINMIVSIGFDKDHKRLVKEIVQVVDYKDGEYVLINC